MEYAHVRRVACGAGTKLHQARDVLGYHDIRTGGANVVELSAQDRLAALRHPCEVRAGAATAHRRLVEVEDAESGNLRKDPAHRAALRPIDRQRARFVDDDVPAQRSQLGTTAVAIQEIAAQRGSLRDVARLGADETVGAGDVAVLLIVPDTRGNVTHEGVN